MVLEEGAAPLAMMRSHFADNVFRMKARVHEFPRVAAFGRGAGLVSMAIFAALCVAPSSPSLAQQAPPGMVPYDHPVYHNGKRVLFHGIWRGKGSKSEKSDKAAEDKDAEPKDAAAPDAEAPKTAGKPRSIAPTAATAPAPAANPATRHEFAVLVDTDDVCASHMAADLVAALKAAGLKARALAGRSSPDALAKYVAGDAGDAAITPVDSLVTNDKTAEWRPKAPYIAKLGRETLEIIGPKSITDISQLNGKTVSLGTPDADADVAGQALFARLGVTPKFVHLAPSASLDQLAGGKIDALVVLGAANSRMIADFGKGGHFHLISAPWSESLRAAGYAPVRVTGKERPNLVGEKENVDTIGAPMALVALDAAPGSARAGQDGALVSAMFEKYDTLLGSSAESSWRDVNLAAVLNWPRLPSAQEWIDAHKSASAPAVDSFRQTAREVASANGGPAAADADKLYETLMRTRAPQP